MRIEQALKDQRGSGDSEILAKAIIDNHKSLRLFTPENMRTLLEKEGYEVTP